MGVFERLGYVDEAARILTRLTTLQAPTASRATDEPSDI